MMKKLAVIIAAACALLCLCACGDDDVYRKPGTGTTLGTVTSADESAGTDNGTYSASPDGDVSDTTDGVLEDGFEDLEDGVERVEDGIDQGMDRAEDAIDGNSDASAPADGSDINGAGQGTGNGATNGNSH